LDRKLELTGIAGIWFEMPNPDEPEFTIEDCKLKIYGCRFAWSFLKLMRRRRTLNIQYSIENIQLL